MKREIKFRGFTKDRENRRWVYGSFHSIYNEKHSFTRRSYTGEKYEEVLPQPLDCAWILEPSLPSEYGWSMADSFRDHKVHHESVGQYTGHKDKNGKEIYEGDVIGNKTRTASGKIIAWPVVFYHGSFCIQQDDYTPHIPIKGFWKNHEIIGNIYEHPELLNQ